jgi:nucleoside-diphosphate-sugar epimerase/GNAT superfamily N-acetyltransferase
MARAAGKRADSPPGTLLGLEMLPDAFRDVDHLEDFLTTPSQALIDDLAAVEGDILVLGAGGKMGPSLAGLAKRAAPAKRVVAVARFSDPRAGEQLRGWGVETLACDLLDRTAVAALPRLPNVIFMAGRKFGETGTLDLTWAMNVLVPALVAEAFAGSRIVAFSTGCVYPYVSVLHQGATEETPPNPPPGEYANSCVGRERMFEHFSRLKGTPGRLIRLNYAIEMRYGVLHDVARLVVAGAPVDVTMGHANMIWQGDANAQVLRTLRHCTVPCSPLNVSGPEVVSIRALAEAFARRFDAKPIFVGEESDSAWLVNTSRASSLFGYPLVPLSRMIDWVADWVRRDLPSLGKPTQFQVRDGVFGPPAKSKSGHRLTCRSLTPQDAPAGVPLSAEPGWNQIEADWRFMIETERSDSFGLFAEGNRLVASGLTVPFGGRFAWISMILVTAEFRRRGHATELMRQCMDALRAKGLTPALDATPEGRQVYLQLGFEDVYRLTRFLAERPLPIHAQAPAGITLRAMRTSDLAAVSAYDLAPFGADRADMLRHLHARLPAVAHIAETDGRLCGYVLGRDGRAATQIGPMVADAEEIAIALVAAALSIQTEPVCIDVPDMHRSLISRLGAAGFVPLVPFIRMIHGRSKPFDDPARIFAIAGPELG